MTMKYHLVLYDKARAKPPASICLANGDKALFLSGHARDERMLYGLVIGSVVPPLSEWPVGLVPLIRARMLP